MRLPPHLLAVSVLLAAAACGADALDRVRDEAPRDDEPAPQVVCGDGRVEGDERCDDGAANQDGWSLTPHCASDCNVAAHCGDGRVDAPDEACDDGARRSGNGCSATCQVEAGFHCAFEPSWCAPLDFGIAPPGTFTMGSPSSEPGHEADEAQVEVTLTRGFGLAIREVTQQEYTSLVGWNPSLIASCSGCPVDTVSWYDALAYANRRSIAEDLSPCYVLTDVVCAAGGAVGTNMAACYDNDATSGGIESASVALAGGASSPAECSGYRLPTEAEWEYAARAGTTTATFNGALDVTAGGPCPQSAVVESIAWFCSNAYDATRAVAGKAANPWGLHDVLGNVWEWVWDRYGDYAAGPLVDPTGAATGLPRSSRGGSYITQTLSVRSASRAASGPGDRQPFRGVRLARTLIQH